MSIVVPPPAPYSVSLAPITDPAGAHNWLIDLSFEPYRREAMRHRSIQAQKANITVDNIPGEGTIDDQGYWRRLCQDWSLGSGQLFYDRRSSVDNRFRQSKGVDIWTQWNMTLLPDTKQVYSTTGIYLQVLQAGQWLYVLDDSTIHYTSNLTTWHTMTGAPNDIVQLTSNGVDLWGASPTQGLFHAVVGNTTWDTYMATGPMSYVGFTGDRLMCSQGPAVYNILNTVTPTIATLVTPLTAGPTYTSLNVTPTTADISAGDNVVVWLGTANGTFVANAEAPTGSTVIEVDGSSPISNIPGIQVGTLLVPIVATTTVTSLTVSGTTQTVTAGDTIIITDPSGISEEFVCATTTPPASASIPVNSQVATQNLPAGDLVSDLSLSASAGAVGDVSPLWTNPNPNWIWNCFQYGSAEIYLSGFVNETAISPIPQHSKSAQNGAIYRTTIDTNGIDLIVPVVALPLEGGEYPTALGGYLNLIMVGTNLGLRVCETLALYDPTGNAGDLKSGPLLPSTIQPVTNPVTGICANGRFIYFNWDNIDGVSTGIARCDLSRFIDQLTPAYASDLMVTGQALPRPLGVSLAWSPISNSPAICIPGSGVWVSDYANLVPEGTLDSGLITYGIPDNKIAMLLDYRTTGISPLSAQMTTDPTLTPNFETNAVVVETPTVTVGTSTIGELSPEFLLEQLTATEFEIRTTLTNSGGTNAPVATQWMLRAIPAVTSGIEVSLVLTLFDKVEDKGLLRPVNQYAEYLWLETLREAQTPCVFVEGPMVFPVCVVDSIDWLPHSEDDSTAARGFRSDLVAYLKVYTPPSPYIAVLPS